MLDFFKLITMSKNYCFPNLLAQTQIKNELNIQVIEGEGIVEFRKLYLIISNTG